jgi:hypothetical protein
MSRVINPETAGTQRNRIVKALVISIRALMSQPDIDDSSLDVAAFMALSLDSIAKTIEATVIPWEKRDYWVKADRFRMEWAWAETLGADMRRGVLDEDWELIAATCVRIAEKIKNVQVSDRHRMGEPWVGAYQILVAGA